MGVLKSDLFTNTSPDVANKLEACATGVPSEMATHFKLNDSGLHIKKVQIALNLYKGRHKDQKIRDFPLDGKYSKEFAEAVAQYKAIKKILNFAKKIDDIVGIKTIRSLDAEEGGNEEPLPLILPPPEPIKKRRKFIRRLFVQSTRSGGDNKPDDGLKDIFNGLLTLGQNFQDSLFVFGDEDVSARSIAVLDPGDSFPIKVQKNITTKVSLINTGFDTQSSSVTITEIKYVYGNRAERNLVVETNFKSEIDGKPENQNSKTEFVPMSVARLDFSLIPPDP